MPAQVQTQLQTQLQTLSLSRLSRLRRQELVERHALRLIALGLVVLSLAGLLYLTQASAVTTTYYEIQELQQQKQHLQRKRDGLRAEIAALTAPEQVRQRALALGFQPAQPTEFLTVTEIPMVAQHPRAASSGETSPATVERLLVRTSSWLQAAMSALPAPQQVEAGPANQ